MDLAVEVLRFYPRTLEGGLDGVGVVAAAKVQAKRIRFSTIGFDDIEQHQDDTENADDLGLVFTIDKGRRDHVETLSNVAASDEEHGPLLMGDACRSVSVPECPELHALLPKRVQE